MLRRLIIIVCSLSFLIGPYFVFAAIVPCDGPECQACDFIKLGQNIIRWLIGTMTIVIGIVFAVGGLKMVTSGGDTHTAESAREMMTNAVIGLIIILVGWLVVDTVMKVFLKQDGRLLGKPWSEVMCVAAPPLSQPSTGGGPVGGAVGGGAGAPGSVPVRDANGNIQNIALTPSQSDSSLNANFNAVNNLLNNQITSACQNNGGSIPNCTQVMTALIAKESGGKPGLTSPAGAVGVMQLLPANGGRTCASDDSVCTQQQINIGVSHLNQIFQQPAVNGNIPNALAGYNSGASTVDGSAANGKRPALAPSHDCAGLLAYQCSINPGGLAETRTYVADICRTVNLNGGTCQ